MKKILHSLIVVLLITCGHFAYAQSSETSAARQEIALETFQIVLQNSNETRTWLLEGSGLTNELGERVVELGANPKAALLSRLEALRQDSRVTVFELSATKDKLTLAMQGLSASQTFSAVISQLQEASNR